MTSVAEIFQSMDYGPAPESDGPARAWLDRHDRRFGLFIDGRWHEPDTGQYFDTIDPSRGEVIAQHAQAGQASIDAAVTAARRAQPGWAGLGGHGRARYLYALARTVQRHSRLLSTLESLDNGKPIRETRDIDIPLVARHFYHHAGWAQLMDTELAGQVAVGVVGQVIPWNFPLLMLAWKVAPALAAGNTVVLKPAEFTSLTALLFAELAAQAGLPPGVLNVLTGDGRTGALLVGHEGVDKVAFTGSTEVGRLIRKATAGQGKHLTLELGGKSPFIVFNDADLDSAVEGVVDAIWFNQGQVCCAGSRLLLQEDIADVMVAKLRARMETLRVGRPLDKCVDIGAIVAPVQLKRVQDLVAKGVDEGATLYQPSWACPTEGCFYPPTLLTDVQPAATLAQEEIFGPVLVTMTFRTPDEAVELANNTRYGLAASVWSESINLALDVAPRLAAGVVWVNSTNTFDAACGFGGYRESGFGREGGIEGMLAYTEPAFARDLPRYDDPEPLPKLVSPAAATATATTTTAGPEPDGGPAASLRALDRTPKMYVGGKQARPDGGYSRPVVGPGGTLLGEVGEGNRKDIRNAVEAARKACGWGTVAAHTRAQILYYTAENLEARADEFTRRLVAMTGRSRADAEREVQATVSRLFSYAAWADKFEGRVHSPPMRSVTLAMHEPVGVVGITCPDDAPLLSLVSLVAPAVAMGNTVVVIPSERHPLAATDLYQVLDTSDVPGGVINIVTGDRKALTSVLAAHHRVDAYWYVGPKEGSALVEELSVGNMKRTWVNHGRRRDWYSSVQGEGREFLRHAVQVKNIWVPYGE
ncbi:MAG: aldehyde dehydrogenase family protein [Myxococcota bacterium]